MATFAMKLYHWLKPQVAKELTQTRSKIHTSFDGWTTKGGHRGFFGIVVHYVNKAGEVKDLPIALPQLSDAHTGERIAELVARILQLFGVDDNNLGYFLLDSAYANDTAVRGLNLLFGFSSSDHHLHCGPHTLNL